MTTVRRRVLLALIPALVAVLLAACGPAGCGGGVTLPGPGSLAASGISLEGQRYKVGGKEFPEQRILCQLAIGALQSVGAQVTDQCGLLGTETARNGLVAGGIDLYYEYTGTGWIDHLGRPDRIPDQDRQLAAVREADAANGLTWLERTPFNDTYALAVNPSAPATAGLTTVSELAALMQGDEPPTLCVETEFRSRPDGLPGLLATYGVTTPYQAPPALTILDLNAVYPALQRSSCAVGEVFSTDARIREYGLRLLDDDRDYFSAYNAAAVVRSAKLGEAPQAAGVLDAVSTRLTDTAMSELNAAVVLEGRAPSTVAQEWLQREGLVGPDSCS